MRKWSVLLSLVLALCLTMLCVPALAEQEIPTIIWYQIGTQPENLAEAVEVMNAYTAEKIGVKVDLRFLNWGEWEIGTNNILNTSEYFDIMFTNGERYTVHANQNKFLDITELKETVAPELTAFVPEALWKGVTIKGKEYAVPTYKDSSQTQFLSWDKAIVEKYEIDIESIKTLQDLDPVLRMIKEGEEAEKGETVYPLPLNKEGFNSILFRYDNYVKFDDETATPLNTYEREEVVADLTLLHSWWEDGIINPDASTLDQNPQYRICFPVQAFPGADVQLSKQNGYEMVMAVFSETIYSTNSILGSVNAISASSNYPEECLKYLELVNTDPYLRNLYAYGIEGQDWEDNGDGTITRLNDTWTAPGYSQATFFTMSPVAPNPPDQWLMVQEQNNQAVDHVILGFSLDNTNIQDEIIAVLTITDKYKPEILSGAYPGTTAEYLEKMNQEMYAAGLQKILDETQQQINEFLGK